LKPFHTKLDSTFKKFTPLIWYLISGLTLDRHKFNMICIKHILDGQSLNSHFLVELLLGSTFNERKNIILEFSREYSSDFMVLFYYLVFFQFKEVGENIKDKLKSQSKSESFFNLIELLLIRSDSPIIITLDQLNVF
jgi:hypothetical protein